MHDRSSHAAAAMRTGVTLKDRQTPTTVPCRAEPARHELHEPMNPRIEINCGAAEDPRPMSKMSSRLSLLALAFPMLGGCFLISHDRTDTPEMSVLVGKHFATVQDAALVRDACLPDHKAKECQQLQVLGGFYYGRGGNGGWHQIRVPVSQVSMTVALAAGAKLTWVPKGSVLTIVQIESKSLGEERRCWVVYATLVGLPDGTVAEIPGCFQWAPESSPIWFTPQELPAKKYQAVQYDYSHKAPSPDPAFLTPVS
jgi:hypothetical protein